MKYAVWLINKLISLMKKIRKWVERKFEKKMSSSAEFYISSGFSIFHDSELLMIRKQFRKLMARWKNTFFFKLQGEN